MARLLLLALIVIAHGVGLALLFDPVSSIWSSDPIVDQDWAYHYNHLVAIDAFWRLDHRLWGYNPYFMAGYPSNTFADLSIKLFELAAIATPAIPAVTAFKLLVVLSTCAAPLLAYFAHRNLFPSSTSDASAMFATLLVAVSWWSSLPREMFFFGMIGFPLASLFALYALSLAVRLVRRPKPSAAAAVAWAAACTVLLPLHLFAAASLAAPLIALAAIDRRGASFVALAAGAIAAALLNAIWIVPLCAHAKHEAATELVDSMPIFVSKDAWTFVKDYLTPRAYWSLRNWPSDKVLRATLLALGVVGLLRLRSPGGRVVGLTLGVYAATLFALTYFGSLLPGVRGLQPLRFKVPLDFALALLAGTVVCAPRRAGAPRWRAWLPRAAVALALGVSVVCVAATEAKGRAHLHSAIREPFLSAVRWLATGAPRDGRVLFEESGDETGFVYGGTYLSSFVPHVTGLQLIGGPANLYPDRHHFAEFHSGLLFKRDVGAFSNEELDAYFELYNVRTIVAFHPRSLARLASLPAVRLLRSFGPLHVLEVGRKASWFVEGSGNVEAGFNRLTCSDVRGDRVVLSYHWVDGLQSDPPIALHKVWLLDDPIPFVRIDRPPDAFELSIGGS